MEVPTIYKAFFLVSVRESPQTIWPYTVPPFKDPEIAIDIAEARMPYHLILVSSVWPAMHQLDYIVEELHKMGHGP